MILVGALVAAVLLWLVFGGSRSDENVPTVGRAAWLKYTTRSTRKLYDYVIAFRALLSTKPYIVDGYAKYKDRTFRIPGFQRDTYFVSNVTLITEIRRAPDDAISFSEVLNDAHQVQWTMPKAISKNAWHFGVLRKVLSSSLADGVLPGTYEEIQLAFDQFLSLPETGEWKSVKLYEAVVGVVVRTNNRMQVGFPLCRNEEYTKLTQTFTETLAMAAVVLNLVPDFMKPLVVRLTGAQAAIRTGKGLLLPIIDERIRSEEKYGKDWSEKPNDYLQWMIDAAQSEQGDRDDIAERLLSINLASTHTSGMTFVRAFTLLLANPQYIQPLREEVELAIKDNGWTKEGLSAMYKVDSFFRESMRLTGIQMTSLNRKVLRPFKLSDGTILPKGSEAAANAWPIHHDESIYPDPDTFDPFRFSRKVEQGESAAHNAFWTPSNDYLVWGLGAHVCAGKQFATQVIKAMMAHVLLNYDFRVQEGKPVRKDIFLMSAVLPDLKAQVEFSRRQL